MTKAEKESLPCEGVRPGGEEKERILTTQLVLRGHALEWQEAQGNENTPLAASGGKPIWECSKNKLDFNTWAGGGEAQFSESEDQCGG